MSAQETPVYNEVFDAYAIIRCAPRLLDESHSKEHRGAAFCSLHQGVEAVAKAIDNLEEAEMQLSRVRSAGGAS